MSEIVHRAMSKLQRHTASTCLGWATLSREHARGTILNMAEAKRPAKVAKLDEEDSLGSSYKETDAQSQAALEKIVNIQQEIDKLNELASEEILHVEQKYNQLRKPHYQKRAELAQQIPEFWSTTVSFDIIVILL